MSRKRFTQIIDKTNNVIPIGGEAQNITLKDGSVLEEALGEINLAEKGSIMDQLNKIKNDTLVGEYAPLVAPSIQQDFIVQQDYISFLPSIERNGSTTKNGITISRGNDSNYYTISGTFTGSSNIAIPLAQKGNDYNTSKIGDSGTYTYQIETNCLKQGKFAIQFYYNKTDTNNNQDRIYITESMLEEQDNIKTVNGTFTIPSGYKLCRIGFYIDKTAQNQSINGNLKLYVYKYHDKSVFRVLKPSPNYDTWRTIVADELLVKNYKISPRSSLGTIYDSSWESLLRVNAKGTQQNGILIQDSGIGFLLSGNTQTLRNRYAGVTSANHRIFAGYNGNTSSATPGIYYDTSNHHNFRIKNSSEWPTILKLSLSEATFYKPILAKGTATIEGNISAQKGLTVQGETKLKTTTATNLEVTGKFKNGNTPIQVNVTSMKILEQIINDSTTYPDEQMLLLRLQHNVVYYLVTGNKSSSSSAASCPAMGFKVNNHSIILFYAGQGKIYRTQYGWPSGQANSNNNRKWTTYSTSLGTNELVGKNPIGEKFL